MAEEYKTYAASEMLTPEGKDDLTTGEIEALGTFLAVNVVGGAWATMDIFGKGSLMDRDNPALEGYKNSPMWNPYRTDDNAIRSRARGPYINIFGETVVSTSNVGGINLEEKGDDRFKPMPPSHALQRAADWMRIQRVRQIWQEALQAFPWGRFFVITQD